MIDFDVAHAKIVVALEQQGDFYVVIIALLGPPCILRAVALFVRVEMIG